MWALLKRERQNIERALMDAAELHLSADDFHSFVLWMSRLTDKEIVEVACEYPDIITLDPENFDVDEENFEYPDHLSDDRYRFRLGVPGCYQVIRQKGA